MEDRTRIERLTPASREAAAIALFRAGQEIRLAKEKKGKVGTSLELL